MNTTINRSIGLWGDSYSSPIRLNCWSNFPGAPFKNFSGAGFHKKELVFFKTLLAGYQYSTGAIPSHCAVNLRASVWYLLAGQRSRLEKPTEQEEEGELEVMKQGVQAFAMDDAVDDNDEDDADINCA